MERRTYLTAAASTATIALAGCSALGGGGSDTETVVDETAERGNREWRFDAEGGQTLTVTVDDHVEDSKAMVIIGRTDDGPLEELLRTDIDSGETTRELPETGRYYLQVLSEDADVVATLD